MININALFTVIVVYKVDYKMCSSYLSLVNAMKKVEGKINLLIYDNSPNSNDIYNTEDINLTYIHDSSNPGVSKAYNIGAKVASKKRSEYILFLDQDSKFDDTFLNSITTTININPDKKLFAPFVVQQSSDILISPSKYINFRGSLIKLTEKNKQLDIKDHSIINSGMVVALDLFNEVGGFNETIKLDFSDHEFIHRISLIIDTISMIPTKIHHSLSSMEHASLESNLYRYTSYLEGGSVFSTSVNKKTIFLYVSFGRCILLSLKTKSFKFCKLFIQSVFK